MQFWREQQCVCVHACMHACACMCVCIYFENMFPVFLLNNVSWLRLMLCICDINFFDMSDMILYLLGGILTSRSTFDDKRSRGGKSHTRHPSEDFLLGPPTDLSQLQSGIEKMGLGSFHIIAFIICYISKSLSLVAGFRCCSYVRCTQSLWSFDSFSCVYFFRVLSQSECIALMNWKGFGSRRFCLNWCRASEFVWMVWGKPLKPSVRILVAGKIRTVCPLNTNLRVLLWHHSTWSHFLCISQIYCVNKCRLI